MHGLYTLDATSCLKKKKSPTAVQINIHIYNEQQVNFAFVQARYCRKCKLQLTRVKYYKVPVCSHEMSMHSCQCCHCVCELSRKPLPWNIYKHELLAYLPDGKDEHLNANDEHNTGCSYKTKLAQSYLSIIFPVCSSSANRKPKIDKLKC